MNLPRNGIRKRHIKSQSMEWKAINQKNSHNQALVDPISRELDLVQSSSPGTSTTIKSTLAPPIKMSSTTVPRALLPRPNASTRQPIPRICLVCNRSNCPLLSHKWFTNDMLARRKTRPPTTPNKGKAPSRSLITPPRRPEQCVQYPVAMNSQREHLLSLWSREWSPTRRGPERHLHPVPWIDRILPAAMSHPALFQALLATSAVMWTLGQTTIDEGPKMHLELADQALSQACTSQTLAASDEGLLAALLITVAQQAQGNAQEADRHFSNIVNLVHSRGGPYYLNLSGTVADLLLYVDFLQAVILGCEPVWKMPLPALQIGLRPRLGAAFRELLETHEVHQDLLLAADSLCRAADIFERPARINGDNCGVLNSFGYLSTVSEYQLAHCNAVLLGSDSWDECVCLALLLFNHIVLRNDGAITVPARKLEHQLWSTVENTIQKRGFRGIPQSLLMWLLITGLSPCIFEGSEYRQIAIQNLRAVKISAGVTGWESVQQKVLDVYIWVRVSQEKAFRGVWLEVEGYTASP